MRNDGYVNAAELLAMPKFKSQGLTFALLRSIVENNSKQRFSLILLPEAAGPIDASNPAHHLLRAAQGHSVAIDSLALLKPLTPPYPLLVHGSFYAFLPLILQSGGLKPMGRTHIHFVRMETYQNGGVISGMRQDSDVIFVIDAEKAATLGAVEWWVSDNGVVLTAGDVDRIVKLDWAVRIEDRRNGLGVLWNRERGVVREVPEELTKRGVPRGKEFVMKNIDKTEIGGRRRGRGGRGGCGAGGGRKHVPETPAALDAGDI